MRLSHLRTTRLNVESLEDRLLLAVCNVNRLTDIGGGQGSRGDLRYCLNKTNAELGADTIKFSSVLSGTINLTQSLPAIRDELDIEGPGADILTIRRNTGDDFRIFLINSDVDAKISGLTIENGGGIAYGGGIWNRGSLTLSYSEVNSNLAGTGGGIYNTGNLIVIGCTIMDNRATVGGGIYHANGILSMVGSTISSNSATTGAGIYNGKALAMQLSRVTGNTASANGGGIFNFRNLTVQYSIISDNQAAFSGGGIYNRQGGELLMEYSTMNGNSSTDGGGLYTDAVATVRNSTFAGNGATRGGAIHNDLNLFLAHSTISGNTASSQGGGLDTLSVTTEMSHTIIAGNNAANGADLYGALASSNYNLIGQSNCGVGSCNFSSTDLLDIDPLLGPLQDNGGPTPTMALLPGSPAIDAGDVNVANPPPWDQRGSGYQRIVGGTIDIGAFEVQSTAAPNDNHESALASFTRLSMKRRSAQR